MKLHTKGARSYNHWSYHSLEKFRRCSLALPPPCVKCNAVCNAV